jgi:hypothetical protein
MKILVEQVGSQIIVKLQERMRLHKSTSMQVIKLTHSEAHELEDKLEDVLQHGNARSPLLD